MLAQLAVDQEVSANEQSRLIGGTVQELAQFCERIVGMELVIEETINHNDSCIGPASVAERAKRFRNVAAAVVKGGEEQQHAQQLKEIGRLIKIVREERGVSRELLACLSNVSRDDIFCFEHGMLTLDEARRIAKQIGQFL